MADAKRLLELIDKIYGAALAPELWNDVLLDIVREIAPGGGAGMLFFPAPGCPPQIVDPTIHPDFARSYMEYFHAIDPAQKVLAELPAGQFYVSSRDDDQDELRRSQLYNEWLRPQGIGDGVGFRLDDPACGTSVAVAIKRTDATSAFGPGDLRLLDHLVPHLRRSLRAHFLLQRGHADQRALGRALDRAAHAVFLLDAHRRVRRMNPAAERLVGAPDGLGLIEGKLVCEDSGENAALEVRLARATAAPPDATSLDGGEGVLAVKRRRAARPLVVHVVPVPPDLPYLGVEPCVAAVFVCDTAALPRPSLAFTRTAFGLTGSESEVAHLVLDGRSPKEIAHLRRTSLHTVKNQLRAVFKKTGTSGQVELARLLASCLPPI